MDEDAVPPQRHIKNRGLIGLDPADALNAIGAEAELEAEAESAAAALPPKPA